jgi:hypothetical protein
MLVAKKVARAELAILAKRLATLGAGMVPVTTGMVVAGKRTMKVLRRVTRALVPLRPPKGAAMKPAKKALRQMVAAVVAVEGRLLAARPRVTSTLAGALLQILRRLMSARWLAMMAPALAVVGDHYLQQLHLKPS